VIQVVQHLPSKWKIPEFNPSTTKKEKNQKTKTKEVTNKLTGD
jgi:hypothetical protein